MRGAKWELETARAHRGNARDRSQTMSYRFLEGPAKISPSQEDKPRQHSMIAQSMIVTRRFSGDLYAMPIDERDFSDLPAA